MSLLIIAIPFKILSDVQMYGVPFYYLFPIYGYPKFILGYP